jgi:hypothetical protein
VNRADEDLDPEDVELDENYTLETRSKSSAHTGEHGVDEYLDISGITTAREAMGKMPEEDKQKILQQVEYFRSEKLKFDREVAKWDDTGNDIMKYPRQGTISSPIVVWKMKAPEKQPLVRPEKSEEVRAKVRKGSQKRCRIRFTPSRNSRVPQNQSDFFNSHIILIV